MSMTLLDHAADSAPTSPADWLRTTTAAVRVSLRWFGVRKTLTPEQKSEAAEPFGADGEFLSASKKILNTKHPAYQGVTRVRGQVIKFWKRCSLPYPEPGIRLIKQVQLDEFNQEMRAFRGKLAEAVGHLDDHYSELLSIARQKLHRLYDPTDYPPSLKGLFGIDWDFPSVEPPPYLLQLSPEIYEQEQARIAGRFEEAIQLAEQAFLGEFAKLVSHLTERLSTGGDGEAKVFRDSAVSNLVEFFDRFRDLNVRSSEQLDQMVEQAQSLIQGVEAQELRDNNSLRQHVAAQLSGVQATLDGMLVDRPRRRIIRNQENHS